MGFDERTIQALGHDVLDQLRSLRFSIIGCGGTGANFAEILVRTGATHLTLIDGTCVEDSNLNRVFGFSDLHCGLQKVDVLKERLESIRYDLNVLTLPDSFRRRDELLEGNELGQSVRDNVYDADVVFIGTDTNSSRIAIEELHREKTSGMLLSCGVLVDSKSGIFEFECAWSPQTPIARVDEQGYGPENASYASIILEATSVAFTMLVSHLKCENSDFRSYRRTYDACFRPIATIINGTPSNSKQ